MAMRDMLPKFRPEGSGGREASLRPSIRPVKPTAPPPPPAPPRRFSSGVQEQRRNGDADLEPVSADPPTIDPPTIAAARAPGQRVAHERPGARGLDDETRARPGDHVGWRTPSGAEPPTVAPYRALSSKAFNAGYDRRSSDARHERIDAYGDPCLDQTPAQRLKSAEPGSNLEDSGPRQRPSAYESYPRRSDRPPSNPEDTTSRPTLPPNDHPGRGRYQPSPAPSPYHDPGYPQPGYPRPGYVEPSYREPSREGPNPREPNRQESYRQAPRAEWPTQDPIIPPPPGLPRDAMVPAVFGVGLEAHHAYAPEAFAGAPAQTLAMPPEAPRAMMIAPPILQRMQAHTPTMRPQMQRPIAHQLQNNELDETRQAKAGRFAWFVFGAAFGIFFAFFATGFVPRLTRREAQASPSASVSTQRQLPAAVAQALPISSASAAAPSSSPVEAPAAPAPPAVAPQPVAAGPRPGGGQVRGPRAGSTGRRPTPSPPPAKPTSDDDGPPRERSAPKDKGGDLGVSDLLNAGLGP